jgi:DNA polymerase-3 subunit gamma/tau
VEDTREMLDNVQYAPTRGRYKVYLIDEVHMLSNHSFNALLKTLEEPPPHIKFLLATTDPQKLPVTILSRCLQFNLKNLGPERIVGHLKHVLGEEKIPFEEAALWELGRAADGSMRDALSLTDQAIAHGGGTVTAAEVNAMLGTIDRSMVADICQAIVAGDPDAVLASVARLADHAPDYNSALADMLSFWHQVAMAQVMPDTIDPAQEHHDLILKLAEDTSREDVQLFYQITLLGRKDLPHAADPRSGFEMVLLRLLAFRPITPDQADSLPVSTQRSEAAVTTKREAAVPTKKSEPAPEAQPESVKTRSMAAIDAVLAQPSRAETSTPPGNPGNNVVPIKRISVGQESAVPASKTPTSELAPAPAFAGEPKPATPPEKLAAHQEPPKEVLPPADELPPWLDQPPLADDDYAAYAAEPYVAEPSEAKQGAVALGITDDVMAEIAPLTLAQSEAKIPLLQLQPEHWFQVCQGLGEGGLLQNLASNMVLESVTGSSLSMVLDADNSVLYEDSHRQRLAVALGNYFGAAIELRVRIGKIDDESPRMTALRLRAERQAKAVASLKADGNVQELCRVFGAELVESSVKPIDS